MQSRVEFTQTRVGGVAEISRRFGRSSDGRVRRRLKRDRMATEPGGREIPVSGLSGKEKSLSGAGDSLIYRDERTRDDRLQSSR